MAAYRRVYNSRHLQADQLLNPTLGSRVWATFLLLHNSVGTSCTTNPEKKIEALELEGYCYSRLRCKTLCIQPLDRRRCNPQARPSTSFVAHTIDLPWRNFLSPQFGAKFGDGKKVKGSPYSITERRVPELIPVLGSQPAGDVSHKLGGMLSLLSARVAVTPATLKRVATSFAAW